MSNYLAYKTYSTVTYGPYQQQPNLIHQHINSHQTTVTPTHIRLKLLRTVKKRSRCLKLIINNTVFCLN